MGFFDLLDAPWSPEQVQSLNDYQACRMFHPYTCACHTTLIATPGGWHCPACAKVVQTWCYPEMAQGGWREFADELSRLLGLPKEGGDGGTGD